MANKSKKQAVKKKATPVKKKSTPEPKKKAAARVNSASKSAKKAVPAAKKAEKAPKKPAKTVNPAKSSSSKPVKKTAQPAAKPIVKTSTPIIPAKANVKPAKTETETKKPVPAPPQAVSKKQAPAKVQPVAPDPENEVLHIVKHGPPPPELKAQFNALKKKKLPPGEKRVVKTEVVNPHIIRDVQMTPEKTTKKGEPQGKFTMEFLFRAPVTLLYDFLTTPSGLVEWFAEEVDLKNDVYKFNWDGAIQYAKIISAKLDSHIRLKWLDKPDGTYLEFRIVPDEMTGQLALLVTDFGENEDDIVTLRQLWDSQITRLMKCLGSY